MSPQDGTKPARRVGIKMKRETKILIGLYLVLVLALLLPIIPYPRNLYYLFPEHRPLTLIEYLKVLILNVVLK